MEYRRLRSSPRLREYLDWPGVEQVCVLERVRRIGATEQRETVFAVTSLTREEASAARLLELARGHWGIENRRSSDRRSDNLCEIGRAGYHFGRGPARVGCVVRPTL